MADSALYQSIPQAAVVTPLFEANAPEDEQEHTTATHIPPATEFRIKWIHFVLGCAVLLPWNALITAMPYFLSRLEGSPFQSTFSSYISMFFQGFNFISITYATYTSQRVSQFHRTRVSIIAAAILTLLLTINIFFHISPGYFFVFTLINAVLQALAAGQLQTSVMMIGSLFGSSIMQAIMSGEAAVGVIVSGVQVISAALSVWSSTPLQRNVVGEAKAEEKSALVFLSLSTLFLVFAVGVHTYLAAMPAYAAAVRANEQHKSVNDEDAQDGEQRGLISGTNKYQQDTAWSQIIRVAKANAPVNLAIGSIFVVTLAVFPAITVLISPTSVNTHPLLFSAIHFFVFNIGDLAGRYICSYPHLIIWSQSMLLILSISRVIFIPLFLMCNIAGTESPIISSDLLFMLILFTFAVTNGYISTAGMMMAPSIEHNPRLKGRREDVDTAATVASFFFTAGLALGGLMSFAVRFAFCRCNPFVD